MMVHEYWKEIKLCLLRLSTIDDMVVVLMVIRMEVYMDPAS